MANKKTSKTSKPKVNKELEGFDIQVNSFGEIITNFDINKINEFLNRNVDDKKLRDRDDIFESEEQKPKRRKTDKPSEEDNKEE
ncbi:hypothetical protein GXP67_19320 [Rhodocytophaga rosea]|uniref:Uncharacterized protein n=1 Tax=Rhodocytophaga rosea TaxID=2704465 RepID=A0A6C0GLY0_9BACT|nr:hypothetical protein [Rhodocytophaga rosea]QHT68640.1 hypothetical protein GXP67_19320 [Rhodocytophaga rosea]